MFVRKSKYDEILEWNREILKDIKDSTGISERLVKKNRELIEALEREYKWIRCDEKLPVIPDELICEGFNRKAVLISANAYDTVVIAWYDIEVRKFYDDFDALATEIVGVEAWKELPEKYKR